MKKIGGEPFPENKAIQDMKTIYGPSKNNPPNRKQFMQLPKPPEPPKETMKTAKDILLENIPKDCWWEEMENLTNTPVEYVTRAMESFAAQSVREDRESRWISVKDRLPEENQWYIVCVWRANGPTVLTGRTFYYSVGLFCKSGLHGFEPITEAVTHYQLLPSPPTNKG